MTKRSKILFVVGARPNFMKIAPILRAFAEGAPQVECRLVHTGQHYDYAMNESFFQQLDIPAPDISLEVGSGTHAHQTAEIMQRFEPVLDEEKADCVLVVGDVNSTIACALVAAKKGVRVVHVEAGLRSRDRTMPEEINRLLTDQLSDRLYVTEREAIDNLEKEGIDATSVVFAGNVMIDTLVHSLPKAVPVHETLAAAGADHGRAIGAGDAYAVLTLHRPSNVDSAATLAPLLSVFKDLSERLPIIFPMHPRTRGKINELGLGWFLDLPGVVVLPPIGYLEMLGLLKSAKVVLTDSGGLQEETTALGVPCLTLRENTERPITITQGTNTLVGVDPSTLARVFADIDAHCKPGRVPELWDGHAAARIARDLVEWMDS